jgi:hypothetical protein
LQASLFEVEQPDDPASAVRTGSRFVVDARQAGAQSA